MDFVLPLEKMSMADKLMTMETLWDDLCRKSDELPSLSWHNDILKEREIRLKEGKENVYSWNDVKDRIRGSI